MTSHFIRKRPQAILHQIALSKAKPRGDLIANILRLPEILPSKDGWA